MRPTPMTKWGIPGRRAEQYTWEWTSGFRPGTPVHALLDGEVVTAVNDAGDKEYGGLVILKHQLGRYSSFSPFTGI